MLRVQATVVLLSFPLSQCNSYLVQVLYLYPRVTNGVVNRIARVSDCFPFIGIQLMVIWHSLRECSKLQFLIYRQHQFICYKSLFFNYLTDGLWSALLQVLSDSAKCRRLREYNLL